jgi:hypothetical protein
MLEIHVNGRPFWIRQNLFSFLQSLLILYPDGYKSLWIDALSIDQQNDKERNHQVQQMKHIYRTAYPTLVWLGPAAGNSDLLLDFLTGFEPRYATKPSAQEVASLARQRLNEFGNENSIASFSVRSACARLAFRSYWSRTWVLQEILIAQKPILICGTKTCSWRTFAMVIAKIGETHFSDEAMRRHRYTPVRRSPADLICEHWSAHLGGFPNNGLISLVLTFRNSECSVKHDKVYGLLGLAGDASNLIIDYRCSVEELCIHLLDWMSPVKELKDAFELAEVLDVSLAFDCFSRLLHPGSTFTDVQDLFAHSGVAARQIRHQVSLEYLGQSPT